MTPTSPPRQSRPLGTSTVKLRRRSDLCAAPFYHLASKPEVPETDVQNL